MVGMLYYDSDIASYIVVGPSMVDLYSRELYELCERCREWRFTIEEYSTELLTSNSDSFFGVAWHRTHWIDEPWLH